MYLDLRRFVLSTLGAVAVFAAFAPVPAQAQHRPAAWDTRVRTVGVSPEAKAPKQTAAKNKSRERLGAAGKSKK